MKNLIGQAFQSTLLLKIANLSNEKFGYCEPGRAARFVQDSEAKGDIYSLGTSIMAMSSFYDLIAEHHVNLKTPEENDLFIEIAGKVAEASKISSEIKDFYEEDFNPAEVGVSIGRLGNIFSKVGTKGYTGLYGTLSRSKEDLKIGSDLAKTLLGMLELEEKLEEIHGMLSEE